MTTADDLRDLRDALDSIVHGALPRWGKPSTETGKEAVRAAVEHAAALTARMQGLEDAIQALRYPRCYLPPGEARTEALFALKILEAEERGARWALERHGHGLADMSREQYAREICEAARGSK